MPGIPPDQFGILDERGFRKINLDNGVIKAIPIIIETFLPQEKVDLLKNPLIMHYSTVSKSLYFFSIPTGTVFAFKCIPKKLVFCGSDTISMPIQDISGIYMQVIPPDKNTLYIYGREGLNKLCFQLSTPDTFQLSVFTTNYYI